MTFEEWSKLSLILAGTYDQSFGVNELKLETWFRLLEDLPGSAVEAAVLHLCKTKAAFPSVAEIRALAEGRGEDEGTLAWKEVSEKAHRLVYPTFVGTPDGPRPVPVEWDDPLVPLALDAVGGALAYMQCEADSAGVLRKHFYTAYKALKEKAQLAQTFLDRGAEMPTSLASQFSPDLLEAIRTPKPPKAKPVVPAPPVPVLPAPDEIAPMPQNFPQAWRRILDAPSPVRHKVTEGYGAVGPRPRSTGKVIRLNEIVRGDDVTPA
jgi:hypothetical protein